MEVSISSQVERVVLTCDSFQSGRYFGSQAQEIRRTRQVEVMVNPLYLQQYAGRTNMHSAWTKTLWSMGDHFSGSFVFSLVVIIYFFVILFS